MAALIPAAVGAAGAIGAAVINSQSKKGTATGTTTGSTQQSVGPEATETANLLQQKTREYANQPYVAYTGQREAAFTPDQLAAFQRTRDLSGQNLNTYGALIDRTMANQQFSGMGQSQALAGNVGNIAQGSMGALPGMARLAGSSGALANTGANLTNYTVPGTASLATTLPQTDVSGYMNPYINQALNPALEDIYRNAEINRQRLNAESVRTGAFGGSRNALAQSEAQRNVEREVGRLSATERAKAYESGLNQFRLDQQNIPKLYGSMYDQLGSAQNLQAGALGANNAMLAGRNTVQQQNLTGQQALQNVVAQGAAETAPLQNLLTSGTTAIQNTVNPLLATGGQQQALQQKTLDRQYQDWIEQRDWGARGLDQLRAALNITPSALGATTNSTQTQYAPNGSLLSAGLGGALAAYGAYNQFNNSKSDNNNTFTNKDYYGNNVPTGYTDSGFQAGDYPMG